MLAKIARVHAQPAYAASTHGQANKWVYLAHMTETCGAHFSKLEAVIRSKLIPSVCNRDLSNIKRNLVSLPARLEGQRMHNPVEVARLLHKGLSVPHNLWWMFYCTGTSMTLTFSNPCFRTRWGTNKRRSGESGRIGTREHAGESKVAAGKVAH